MDVKQPILSEAGSETHPQKSKRGALRWVLGALLAFGLGALLITYALYIPTRQKLDKANSDLENANAMISDDDDQITALQTSNKVLEKNLDSTLLHMYILKALSEVREASLTVAADNYAGARLSLIQTSEALDTLSSLLATDQIDVLTAMQQSAAQALTELKIDLESAQPELDQLTKNLVQLEGNLFPKP